jgi:two-component system response regulator CpxR
MLTARGEETDRIVGLEMGADDYLPKTFSSRELLARLRAVIRRHSGTGKKTDANEAGDMVFGDLRICKASRTVRMGEDTVNLTPVEYDLLILLADASGRVLTRDHLLNAFAGRSYEVFDRSVDVHISSLRRKLKEDPRNPKFIRTVRTAGYMFTDPGDPA